METSAPAAEQGCLRRGRCGARAPRISVSFRAPAPAPLAATSRCGSGVESETSPEVRGAEAVGGRGCSSRPLCLGVQARCGQRKGVLKIFSLCDGSGGCRRGRGERGGEAHLRHRPEGCKASRATCGIGVFFTETAKSSRSYCLHRENVIRGSEKAHVGLRTSAARSRLTNKRGAAAARQSGRAEGQSRLPGRQGRAPGRRPEPQARVTRCVTDG